MTWAEVARKDLHDAIRARWLWILAATLTILGFCGPIVLEYYLGIGRLPVANAVDDPTTVFASYSRALSVTLVPLLTLVMSYASITREWESGSIKVLLSLPHSRRDIVVGKFVGRSLAVVVSITAGLAIAAVLLAVIGGLTLTDFVAFSVVTLALAVTVTGVGIGISALMDTTRRAILASIVALALFLVFWNGTVDVVASIAGIDESTPMGYTVKNVATLVNPIGAYNDLAAPFMVQGTVAQGFPRDAGPAPVILKAPFSILVLVVWTVGSLLVGTRHFERIDL
jgi:ABC-2 type transport system permease protein